MVDTTLPTIQNEKNTATGLASLDRSEVLQNLQKFLSGLSNVRHSEDDTDPSLAQNPNTSDQRIERVQLDDTSVSELDQARDQFVKLNDGFLNLGEKLDALTKQIGQLSIGEQINQPAVTTNKEKKTEENQQLLQQISSKVDSSSETNNQIEASRLEKILEGTSKKADTAGNVGLGASAAVFSGDPVLATLLGGASKLVGKTVEKGAGFGSRALANRRAKKQEEQNSLVRTDRVNIDQQDNLTRVDQVSNDQQDNLAVNRVNTDQQNNRVETDQQNDQQDNTRVNRVQTDRVNTDQQNNTRINTDQINQQDNLVRVDRVQTDQQNNRVQNDQQDNLVRTDRVQNDQQDNTQVNTDRQDNTRINQIQTDQQDNLSVNQVSNDQQDNSSAEIQASRLERILEGTSKKADTAGNVGLGASAAVFSGDPVLATILGGASKGISKTVGKGAELGAKGLANRRAKQQQEQQTIAPDSTLARVNEVNTTNQETNNLARTSITNDNVEGNQATNSLARISTITGDNQETNNTLESPTTQINTEDGDDNTITNQSFTNLTDNVEELKDVSNTSEIQDTLEDRVVPSLESMVTLLQAGLPTAQEKAQEKRALIKARRAKKDSNTLERTSGDSPDAGGGLTILGTGLLGTLFTKIKTGISTSLSFIFKKLPGMLLRFIPRLITKIPFIGFVFSLFKGLFDGVKSLLNGASIGEAIMTTITSFADSLIKIFSFGLLDLSTLQDWFAPVFDMIFGGLDKLIGFLSFGLLDLEGVVNTLTNTFGFITDIIGSVFNVFGNIFSFAKDFIVNRFTDVIDFIKNPFDFLANRFIAIKDFFVDKFKSIGGLIGSAFDFLGNIFGNIGGMIKSAVESVLPNWVKRLPGVSGFFESDKADADQPPEPTLEQKRQAKAETIDRTAERASSLLSSNRNRRRENVDSPNTVVPPLGTVNEQSANNQSLADSPLIFETKERDEAARIFSETNRQGDVAPVREQSRQAREMNQQLSNNLTMMNQNNVSQNQNITIGRSARKQDYLAGSMNREMDFSGT